MIQWSPKISNLMRGSPSVSKPWLLKIHLLSMFLTDFRWHLMFSCRDWSLPPTIISASSALAPGTYTRYDTTVAPRPTRMTLWSRLRVGMSQMFRRVAVFFRRRGKKPRSSSMGSSSSGRYWDSMEDEVGFVEVISPHDSAVVGTETPTRLPSRPPASKPVNRQRRSAAHSMPMSAVCRRAAVF